MSDINSVQLHIDSLSSEGAGIARHDNMVVFVDAALPGDVVEAVICKRKKNFALARILRIIEPSTDRIEPACPHYASCGGCSLLNLDYNAQLKAKAISVADRLNRIGGLNIEIPQVRSFKLFRYRNRVQWHYRDGKLGFYERAGHEAADISACLLVPHIFDSIFQALSAISLPANLRHITLQSNEDNSKIMLIFSCADCAYEEELSRIVDALREQFAEITSVWANYGATNSLHYGARFLHIAGDELLPVTICGKKVLLYPSAFVQVNYDGSTVMYKQVLEWAELTGTERVYDIYCGIGTLTMLLADKARYTCGIELNPQSIAAAKVNAESMTNINFICDAAEAALPRLIAEQGSCDLIVLDPPRSGCHDAVLKAVMEARPGKIIYISCDPATLARDLKALNSDYELAQILCYDLFPHTPHIETACLLHRKPIS